MPCKYKSVGISLPIVVFHCQFRLRWWKEINHPQWHTKSGWYKTLQTWRHRPWAEPPARFGSGFERFGPAAWGMTRRSAVAPEIRVALTWKAPCIHSKSFKENTDFESNSQHMSTSNTCYMFDIHTGYTPC
jgi:hypothetical protein